MLKKISDAANYIKTAIPQIPHSAVVLGSGLGQFAQKLTNTIIIDYKDIPGFKIVTVPGHEGKLIYGKIEDVPILLLQGRFHFYEGHTLEDVCLPVRVLAKLGVKNVILTNASGGINANLKPADLALVTDHINLSGHNPLFGHNLDELGVRFPDMSDAYNLELQTLIKSCAQEAKLDLKTGVYGWMLGPSYETPAEIRMLKTIGADLVGMSTVPEIIAGHHAGLKMAAIACVTNYAAGITNQKLNHEEVKEVANQVFLKFSDLLSRIILKIG